MFFGLKIQRTPWAAARGLLQHIATISTRLCAMGVGPLMFKFSKEAIRDLLRKDVMHYSTGPEHWYRLRFKMGLSPQYAGSQISSRNHASSQFVAALLFPEKLRS